MIEFDWDVVLAVCVAFGPNAVRQRPSTAAEDLEVQKVRDECRAGEAEIYQMRLRFDIYMYVCSALGQPGPVTEFCDSGRNGAFIIHSSEFRRVVVALGR